MFDWLIEEFLRCQNCHNQFLSDSPHHDAYCGDCRVKWQNKKKEISKQWLDG